MSDTEGLLGRLVPHGVVVVERLGASALDMRDLRYAPDVAQAVPKRQNDLMAGRACAHAALHQIRHPVERIASLASGAPDWPDDIRGAITHCAGYVGCAVALASHIEWLGIDAEPADPMPQHAAHLVAFGQERHWIAEGSLHGRILFCAKEAVFKAWHPVRNAPLDFADAALTFDAATQRFTASIQRGAALKLHGRWSIQQGIIGACIAQPR